MLLSLNNYKEDMCFSKRDLLHYLEGQRPEQTDSPFRTQVGVGRIFLTDLLPASKEKIRMSLALRVEKVRGGTLQEERSLCAKTQKEG